MLHNDILFHADIQRVVSDMSVFDAKHKRTNVHPLFVLFTNPLGLTLWLLIGSSASAALLLNSASGGLCIALSGYFFCSAGISISRSILLSLIMGSSTAHVFFGSAPETYSFSALSIVVLFYLAGKRPGNLRYFIPAGIFGVGILITNAAIAIFAFGSSLSSLMLSPRKILHRLFVYSVVLVGSVGCLAVAQKLIWRSSALFFVPQAYVGESQFVKTPTDLQHFLGREALLTRYMLAFDWFAPRLLVNPDSKREVTVRFDNRKLSSILSSGRVALFLWAIFLLGGSIAFFRYRMFLRPLPLGLFSSLSFYFILHSVYGDDLFLYSCNTGFLLIALAALSIAEFRSTAVQNWLCDAGLLTLLCSEVANNLKFVSSLVLVKHS